MQSTGSVIERVSTPQPQCTHVGPPESFHTPGRGLPADLYVPGETRQHLLVVQANQRILSTRILQQGSRGAYCDLNATKRQKKQQNRGNQCIRHAGKGIAWCGARPLRPFRMFSQLKTQHKTLKNAPYFNGNGNGNSNGKKKKKTDACAPHPTSHATERGRTGASGNKRQKRGHNRRGCVGARRKRTQQKPEAYVCVRATAETATQDRKSISNMKTTT